MMTKQKLQALSKEAALEVLNKSHTEGVDVLDLFSENEKEEYESICAECFGQTEQKTRGDEGWTVCDNCQMVEGSTLEITTIPSLGIGYIWNSKKWIVADDSIGQTM